MKLGFLKPKRLNILLTVIILLMPLLRESVADPDGTIHIARYQPLVLLGAYIVLGEFRAFMLMLGYCLLIYVIVSLGAMVFSKVTGYFIAKRKKSISF